MSTHTPPNPQPAPALTGLKTRARRSHAPVTPSRQQSPLPEEPRQHGQQVSLGVRPKDPNAVLTPGEADFRAAESVIAAARPRTTFVELGLAFARIRDSRLYRLEFRTFEAYCRSKWQCSMKSVYQLIAAARVFTRLQTSGRQHQPGRESQIRPLAGLSPQQADEAWARAVEKANGRRVTARLVKSAMEELELPAPTRSRRARLKPAQQRRVIEEDLGRLLVLTSQRASYELLTTHIEALRAHFRSLFACSSRRQISKPAQA